MRETDKKGRDKQLKNNDLSRSHEAYIHIPQSSGGTNQALSLHII